MDICFTAGSMKIKKARLLLAKGKKDLEQFYGFSRFMIMLIATLIEQ